MKLDYKYFKEILLIMEESLEHEIEAGKIIQGLNARSESNTLDKFVGHMLILGDQNCITTDAKNFGILKTFREPVDIAGFFRITNRGYELLNILKNDTVFNKVKDSAISIAIETGKALLIKALAGS